MILFILILSKKKTKNIIAIIRIYLFYLQQEYKIFGHTLYVLDGGMMSRDVTTMQNVVRTRGGATEWKFNSCKKEI